MESEHGELDEVHVYVSHNSLYVLKSKFVSGYPSDSLSFDFMSNRPQAKTYILSSHLLEQ